MGGGHEFLKRRNVRVLAQPLNEPVSRPAGNWFLIAQSQAEYSTCCLWSAGFLRIAILRRSFWFGLAAALAGNGGLWYLLHETSDYHFFQHPQAWLIPVAVSVLVAAHLNRKDFSPAQMTTIRYLCLMTIYVSSTADIFINVGDRRGYRWCSPTCLLPGMRRNYLSRSGVSVARLNVSAVGFVTMINYASVNLGWTWLWYVAESSPAR
jgi:hypothetical protein